MTLRFTIAFQIQKNGLIDEAAELQREMNMKHSDKLNDLS